MDEYINYSSQVCAVGPSNYIGYDSTANVLQHDLDKEKGKVAFYKDLADKIIAVNKDMTNSTKVKKILFNPPATIVFWQDNTKTVVKAMSVEDFNPYHGFCAALAKKVYGNNSYLQKMITRTSNINMKEWYKKDENVEAQ